MSAFFGLELKEGRAEYFRASSFTPLVLLQRATIVFTSSKTLPLGCVVQLKSRMKHEPSQVLASFIIGKVESVALNCEFSDDVRLSISREGEGDKDEDFDFAVHVTGLVVFNLDTGDRDELEENEGEDMSSDDSEPEEEEEDSLSWTSDTTTDEEKGREEAEGDTRAIRCLSKAPAHLHITSKEWKYEHEERVRIQREALEKPIEEEIRCESLIEKRWSGGETNAMMKKKDLKSRVAQKEARIFQILLTRGSCAHLALPRHLQSQLGCSLPIMRKLLGRKKNNRRDYKRQLKSKRPNKL